MLELSDFQAQLLQELIRVRQKAMSDEQEFIKMLFASNGSVFPETSIKLEGNKLLWEVKKQESV